MVNQEYSIAISQTLEILSHTKKEDVDKIPIKFLNFLKENASKTYISSLDFSKPLEEMSLSSKTIGILSIINRKYWCNEEEKKDFDEKLNENEILYQHELYTKYNPNDIFTNKKNNIIEERNSNSALIEVKNISLLQRIKQFIKNIFKDTK